MSEPGMTSDKIKRRSRSFVRTRYDFRQNQEGKHVNLSEPGMTSDKMKESRDICPNLAHFGQNQRGEAS